MYGCRSLIVLSPLINIHRIQKATLVKVQFSRQFFQFFIHATTHAGKPKYTIQGNMEIFVDIVLDTNFPPLVNFFP